ncbi:MAG TPA: STAS domain-containing protein [Flavitalea sp.]|nr:STAS domain-containing protein [Flavitalea sp.]
MGFKIDTRDKFHVITIQEAKLAANMTEKLDECLIPFLGSNVKNVVLNIKDIEKIDKAAAGHILALQRRFYAENASFVVCEIQPELRKALESADLYDLLNTTPTESEAYDIVQMEELERELMSEDGDDYPEPE